MKMKKYSILLALCGALLLVFANPAVSKTVFLGIGTGGTGGIYYPYGGGVAEIWTQYVPGVKAVAEVTGASVENVKLASKGETVVGEVMGDVAVAGYNGASKFKGKNRTSSPWPSCIPTCFRWRPSRIVALQMWNR